MEATLKGPPGPVECKKRHAPPGCWRVLQATESWPFKSKPRCSVEAFETLRGNMLNFTQLSEEQGIGTHISMTCEAPVMRKNHTSRFPNTSDVKHQEAASMTRVDWSFIDAQSLFCETNPFLRERNSCDVASSPCQRFPQRCPSPSQTVPILHGSLIRILQAQPPWPLALADLHDKRHGSLWNNKQQGTLPRQVWSARLPKFTKFVPDH